MESSDRDFVNKAIKNTYYKNDEKDTDDEIEMEEPIQDAQGNVPYLKILSILCFVLAICFI